VAKKAFEETSLILKNQKDFPIIRRDPFSAREITRGIIQEQGLAGFLPTLCLPKRQELAVLQGIPQDQEADVRTIALDWAKGKVDGNEEFLLAFREGASGFRVLRCLNGKISEELFSVEDT